MILAARTPQISHVLSNSTGFLKFVQSVPLTVRVTACKKYTGSPFVADKQVQRPIIYYNYNTLASEFIGSTHIKFVRRTSPYSTMPSRGIITQVDDIIKSPEDNRSYRGLELSNKLRVLLVSDPTTDKSSAAMDVHIGHMSDPSELPGLAHFCEHMLFLGTKKYPSENEYNKFLSEHGGSSNAFTSAEHTNFYFDVAAENLSGALDRFSQFFVEPLFTASATDREVNAVNSENDKNLQSDLWRLHQLERSTANANHAYSKFGTGNKYTLETRPKERGIDVREELLKFHSKYYSANGMGLAVLGKESLDELSEMVVSMFSGVQNKDITIPEWPIHPYGPNEVKLQAHVVPVKDLRNLNVTWPIPDLEPYYKSNPGHYLGHLLGHEGAGSLLSELKSRGWVNHLVGGQKNGAKGFMFIIVNVDLTEEGIKHTDDIVMLINQYLNLLRKEGPQEWIFKECQDLSAMTFRFKDKEKPASYTSSLAAAIHDYPMKEVLCGGYLLEEYRADLIEMVLDKLTPDNTRIAVIGQQFEGKTDLEEEWYKTQYSLKAIEENMLQSWRNPGFSPNLRLPDRNEFIPTNFDLVTREEEQCPIPQLVRDTAMTRLWFRQDDKFLLPKACIYVDFISAHAYVDPPAANMCYMFVRLLQDSLNEYAYAAELAGIHYKIQSTIYGLTVTAKGYNDKLPILLHRIVDKMCTFEIDPQRFNILKEEYVRSLKNFRAEQPHQHAIYHTATLMAEQMWTKEELLEATDELTLDGLRTFVPHLLSRVYLEMLAYGNMTKQKSMEVADAVENILQTKCNTKPLQQSQQRRFREVQLPDGCYYVYRQKNEVHSSSSLEVYYQCSVQDTHANMMLELFCHIIAEPCFDILRTQEQLGYIVFSGVRRSNGAQGLRVIVQSDKSPQFVESRIEAFLAKMESHIHEMTDEVYQKHVGALASRRLEKPKKLGAQALKYWGEIVSQQYNFDRDNLEVAHLKTLTKDDIFKFYKDMIASDAPHRHKLSVHVIADAQQTNGDDANDASGTETGTQQITQSALDGIVMEPPGCEEPVEVTDKTAFKRSMALFPLPKPVFNFAQAKSKL